MLERVSSLLKWQLSLPICWQLSRHPAKYFTYTISLILQNNNKTLSKLLCYPHGTGEYLGSEVISSSGVAESAFRSILSDRRVHSLSCFTTYVLKNKVVSARCTLYMSMTRLREKWELNHFLGLWGSPRTQNHNLKRDSQLLPSWIWRGKNRLWER